MAYVRTRTTKAGNVSTTLVEAYRDDKGQPRQRVLANLHGEPDLLAALAKLAVRRDDLRKEKDKLGATEFPIKDGEIIPAARRAFDKLVRRIDQIEADLAVIQKDGIAIKRHCSATPEEVQAAIQAYKKKHAEAEHLALGISLNIMLNKERQSAAIAKLKRVSIGFDKSALNVSRQLVEGCASDSALSSYRITLPRRHGLPAQQERT
ncbi:MAG TPA: hypothetical protein VH684_25505 [Xanthobacteraceae bacterium]|jgi:hypothetical protein